MSISQSIQLGIDARPAEAGKRQYLAAISAIKQALAGLEKDSSGMFKNLAPKVDTSAIARAASETRKLGDAASNAGTASDRAAKMIQQTALAASMAMRQASMSAQKLHVRLGDLGDQHGLAQLEGALDRLQTKLAQATTPAGVRSARAEYEGLRTGLTQTATAAEHAKGQLAQLARQEADAANAAQRHAASLTSLRAAHDPLFAASQRYETALCEIKQLTDAGQMSDAVAAQARDRAAQTYLGAASAADKYAASSQKANIAVTQMSFQANDVLTMAFMGASPLQIAASQTGQLVQVMQQAGSTGQSAFSVIRGGMASILTPQTALIAGAVALTAVLVQWGMSGSASAKSFSDSLSDAETSVTALNAATRALTDNTLGGMSNQYGRVNEDLREHLRLMAQVAQFEAIDKNAGMIDSIQASVKKDGNIFTTEVDAWRRALDSTNDRARYLLDLMGDIKDARTFDQQAAAITKLRQEVSRTTGGLEGAEGAGRQLLTQLIKAEDQARMLAAAGQKSEDAIVGATSQTHAWAGAMQGVASSISAVLDALNSIGGGAIANASKRAQIAALDAGASVRDSEIARKRAEYDINERMKLDRASGAGVIGGWAQRQMVGFERYQFEESIRLDNDLNTKLEAARERESKSSRKIKGSGKSPRVEALGDESRQLSRLSKDLNNRLYDLDREAEALAILAQGQVSNIEAARMLADAQAMGGTQFAQNAARITEYNQKLAENAALERDIAASRALIDYRNELPTQAEGVANLKVGTTNAVREGLQQAFMGEFDLGTFVNALRQQLSQVLADRTLAVGMDFLGIGKETATITAASTTGAAMYGTAITSASAAGAAMFAAALQGAAIPAAAAGAASGGGGGIFGAIGGFIGGLFGFAEGGYSDRAGMSVHTAPIAAFRHAPHYKQGTANTSGIPAILHDNEAVVPLTKGRKIPVDAKGLDSGAGNYAPQFGDITINTPVTVQGDATDPQTASRVAKQTAEAVRLVVKDELASQLQYGGLINPRGGRF